MTRPPLKIRAIGCIAHAALERSDGAWQPLPGFGDSPYVQAGGDIIWIGNSEALMHPRSVVLDGATRAVAGERLRAGALVPWQPPMLSFDTRRVAALRAGCAALHRDLMRIGAPQGFAAMLAGRVPDFPLDRAAFRVRKLAQSFHDTDVESVYDAALPLLGLALTDRFTSLDRGLFEEALVVFGRLSQEYERVYYTGIAWERELPRDQRPGQQGQLQPSVHHPSGSRHRVPVQRRVSDGAVARGQRL